MLKHNGMASIKFMVNQACTVNQYKNIRVKVLKCCANILVYFNKQCLIKKITPNYAKTNLSHTSPATLATQKK